MKKNRHDSCTQTSTFYPLLKNVLETSFGAWRDEDHPELREGVDSYVRNLRKSSRSDRIQ